jgi:enterochelin esterase family protein
VSRWALGVLCALAPGAAGAGSSDASSPVDPAARGSALEAALSTPGSRFEQLAALERLLESQPTFPIVEGEGLVHFVFRGSARDVRLEACLAAPDGDPLHRFPGSDIFYRSYSVQPGERLEYRFLVDGETRLTDPRNPYASPGRDGVGDVSELRAPGYEPAPHTAAPAGYPRGRLVDLRLRSSALDEMRRVRVYLPAGYAPIGERYPLLVVSDGFRVLRLGRAAHSLDNLINARVTPIVAAFVEAHMPEEGVGRRGGAYARLLGAEIVPFLEGRFFVGGAPERRAVLGVDRGTTPALAAAAIYPGSFGKLALQSVHLDSSLGEEAIRALGRARQPLEVYLDWSRCELRSSSGQDLREHAARLVRRLESAGLGYYGGEAPGGSGWGSWRSRTDRVLEAFFPLYVGGRRAP